MNSKVCFVIYVVSRESYSFDIFKIRRYNYKVYFFSITRCIPPIAVFVFNDQVKMNTKLPMQHYT